MLWLTEIEL